MSTATTDDAVKSCYCSLIDLMTIGCTCGAMDEERERNKKEEDEK